MERQLRPDTLTLPLGRCAIAKCGEVGAQTLRLRVSWPKAETHQSRMKKVAQVEARPEITSIIADLTHSIRSSRPALSLWMQPGNVDGRTVITMIIIIGVAVNKLEVFWSFWQSGRCGGRFIQSTGRSPGQSGSAKKDVVRSDALFPKFTIRFARKCFRMAAQLSVPFQMNRLKLSS